MTASKIARPGATGAADVPSSMTSTETRTAALSAVPDYPEITAALSLVGERTAALLATDPPPPTDPRELAERLVRGEKLPEELGTAIGEGERLITARGHEVRLLTAVRDELERRRDDAIRTRGSAGGHGGLATTLDS